MKRNLRLAFELVKANPAQHRTLVPGFDVIHPSDDFEIGPVSQDSMPRSAPDGIKRYYNSSNKLHRRDGPAVISPDGNKLYYQWGKLHREDGPAALFHDGTEQWYLEGEKINPTEVLQLKIAQGKITPADIDTLNELSDIAFFDSQRIDINAFNQAGELLREKGCIHQLNKQAITDFLRAAKRF